MKYLMTTAALLLLVGTSGVARAAEAEVSMMHFAQRKNSESGPRITTLGVYAVRDGTAAHFDVAEYDDPQGGKAWATEFGAGYLLPTRVNVFIGGGVVAGYRRTGGDYFAAWYPEIGAVIPLTDSFGVSVSKRRYQKLYQQNEDVLMFGLVLTTK